MDQHEQLRQAIAALEAQRGLLGDAVVEATQFQVTARTPASAKAL